MFGSAAGSGRRLLNTEQAQANAAKKDLEDEVRRELLVSLLVDQAKREIENRTLRDLLLGRDIGRDIVADLVDSAWGDGMAMADKR